jgi:hypothetical protein
MGLIWFPIFNGLLKTLVTHSSLWIGCLHYAWHNICYLTGIFIPKLTKLYTFSKQSDIPGECQLNKSKKVRNLLTIHGHSEEVYILWSRGMYFNKKNTLSIDLDEFCCEELRANFCHILKDFQCFVHSRSIHISKNTEEFCIFTTNQIPNVYM